ncbi:hypothetical protein C6P46_006371 [Rhodotorula mucilaginosa]|uniref:GPI inositol-deacylase n=1 Tax=Rhodotorula mucilaginosa TaxID=5537 RepID=A0A9P6W612_RHOMI|nr:hypothetical protein C6P46_006371 [Rhodotorula mucilaginosa]
MSRSAADSANSSSTRASPDATPRSIEADAEADAQSTFASSSTPIAKPPLARLASVSPHLSPSSPLLLESLTRSTLPSASLTASHASWVDLSRPAGPPATSPPKSLLASTSASPTSPNSLGKDARQSSERPTSQFRKRSASVGSLKALIERDRSGSAGTEAAAAAPRRKSSQLERPSALVEEDSASTSSKAGGPDVSQLSWGRWWPFAVVDPADADSKPPPPPPTKDGSADPTESFLSLFAGKKAVQEARSHHLAREEQDRLEAELLNASLDELDISAGSFALEADEVSREISAADARGKPLPRTPAAGETGRGSFLPGMPSLPNLFSTSGARDTAASTSSPDRSPPTQSSSKAANGDGPSLLSSFAVPNPFTSSPAAFFPSIGSSKPSPRNSARPFSTSRTASKQKDDGPDTKASEAKKMVDPEDRETIKEEEQVDLDTFTLLKDKYRTPKLPIVFCHGLFGFDYIGPAAVKPLRFSYWIGVEEALQAMGVQTLIGRVPASASIEERAKVLCQMIGEKFPGQDVNLIGHSMGGLDGRFLISHLKPTNFRVRSLTTISTPHRGSSFADYLLEDIVGVERVPALMGAMKALGVPGGGKAFDDLTTTKMARFNEETPDDPNVRYFSYGAYFEPSWSNAFRIPWGVVYEREGANDGLVSVDSAKWGEYRATLENVNHLDLVGWIGKFRYSYAAWSGNDIKFRPVSFYCAVAEQLADEGF